MQITLPQRPTRATLTAYLEPLKTTVKGKMVLVGVPQQVQVTFTKPALRRDDADVTQLNAAPAGGPAPQQQPATPAPQQPAPPPAQPRDDQPLNNNQLQQQLNQFLVDSGALVRINDGGRDHGQIRAFNNPAYDRQGAADRRDAQRGLRPHLAARRPMAAASNSNSTSSTAAIRKGGRATT